MDPRSSSSTFCTILLIVSTTAGLCNPSIMLLKSPLEPPACVATFDNRLPKTGLLSIPEIMLPISGCPSPPCLLRGTLVGCGVEDGGAEVVVLLLLALVFCEATPCRNCWATETASLFWLTEEESVSVVLPDGFAVPLFL
jgi:hypothetical protein